MAGYPVDEIGSMVIKTIEGSGRSASSSSRKQQRRATYIQVGSSFFFDVCYIMGSIKGRRLYENRGRVEGQSRGAE